MISICEGIGGKDWLVPATLLDTHCMENQFFLSSEWDSSPNIYTFLFNTEHSQLANKFNKLLHQIPGHDQEF